MPRLRRVPPAWGLVNDDWLPVSPEIGSWASQDRALQRLPGTRRRRTGICALAVPSLTSYVVQTLLILVGLGALAWILVVARRPSLAKQAGRGQLSLVGRLPLEGRRAVYVVRVGERVLVLGGSEAGVTKLAEMPTEEFPSELPTTSGEAFSSVLGRVLGKRGAAARPSPGASASLRRDSEEPGPGHA